MSRLINNNPNNEWFVKIEIWCRHAYLSEKIRSMWLNITSQFVSISMLREKLIFHNLNPSKFPSQKHCTRELKLSQLCVIKTHIMI